ncbi:MAG: hypothetical protein JXQ73_06620 [Phycisphaerae bacterium]|nr:hypothetical protein [Phycisphaerae bacterium]
MPMMHGVYSFQKPGVAWRGIVAAALILALSTAAAWLVVRHKRSGRPIELSEPVELKSLAVRVRVPKGWTRKDKKVEQVEAVLFKEPTQESPRLIGVISWPATYSPAHELALLQHNQLALIGVGILGGTEAGGAAALGPLRGWQLRGMWHATERQGVLATRTAWCPGNRAYLVVVRNVGALHSAEMTCINAICGSFEPVGLELSARLDERAAATGIHFDLPAGTSVVTPRRPSDETIDLIAGPTAKADWRIRIYRAWPRPGGDLEALVVAYRTEQLQDMSAGRHVEQESVGVNTAWRTGISYPKDLPKEFRSGVEVWAVRHRQGPAAMILGQSSGLGLTLLRNTCQGIARSFRIEPKQASFDEAAAERLGAETIAEIGREGIGRWWGHAEDESWYAVRARDETGFIWQHHRSAPPEAGKARFQGGGITLMRYVVVPHVHDRADLNTWWIDADADGFRFEQLIPGATRQDHPVRLVDRRRPGEQEVEHYITIEGQRYQGRLTTPGNFLPDPIMDLGLHRVAMRPQGDTAIFTVIGTSERMLHRRICRSLGKLPDEDDGQGGPVYGVTIRHDYDPTLGTYLFDERGAVLRVERGDHFTATRTTRMEIEDQFEAKTVAATLKAWNKTEWLSSKRPATASAPSTRPSATASAPSSPSSASAPASRGTTTSTSQP